MADNTQLNLGTGGDLVRSLGRQNGPVKTPVSQIDIGGASANAEILLTGGQQVAALSLPVVIASNQPAIPVTLSGGTVSVANFPTTQVVTGTFWQTTQPISAATLPLPANAAQESGGNLAAIAAAVVSGAFQDNIKSIGGNSVLVGAGGVGSGALRIAVGQDTSTIAGSAPGAAGSPSSNVVTVQGVPGMTPIAISGSVSASLGGFIPAGVFASPVVANGSSSSTALTGMTAGQTAVVYNPGSTPVNVVFGGSPSASATTGDIIQADSWTAFVIPAGATHLATWGLGGATALQVSAGSGLPTGAGGGGSGGGGGGGTVTQGTPGSASAAWYVTPGNGATWTLGASSSVIGLVGQSGTWTISLAGGSTIASTQSGNWTSRTVGAAGATLDSAAGTPNGQAITIQGNASGIAMPIGAPPSLPLPAGAATAANQSLSNVGYGAQATNQIPVTASSTPIVTARTGSAGTGRGMVKFFNVGGNQASLGTPSVTYSNGYPLSPGESTDWFPSTAAWSAICNSGLTTVIAFVELF